MRDAATSTRAPVPRSGWRLGDAESARRLSAAELADVRTFGAPRALGIALRTAGLVDGGSRRLALLEGSVAVLRGSPALLERAHSLSELGATLRRAGRRTDAREPLAEALEIAARCGARPLAARVRDELKATGARPRREWRTGLEALTPSELRVARLAADGHSNRRSRRRSTSRRRRWKDIFCAYAKLAIEGRTGLAHAFPEEKTRGATP